MANRLNDRLSEEALAAIGRIDDEAGDGPPLPDYVVDAIAYAAAALGSYSDGSDAAMLLFKGNIALMKNLYRAGHVAGVKLTRLELKAGGG